MSSKPSPAARAPYKRPWPTSTPLKDADLERILERLDRIGRDVEASCIRICERLGVALHGDTEEEDSDSEEEAEEVSDDK